MPRISTLPLGAADRTTTTTLLHEAIPLTGSIISGTYVDSAGSGLMANDDNIKTYTHGMFQSVYDYPYLSSSANHIFDITCGYDELSSLSSSASTHYRSQESRKLNMYNQFSQTLVGYGTGSGAVRRFELDLSLDESGQVNELFMLSLSRLLTKDQIKPGTFSMTLGTGSWADPFGSAGHALEVLTDASASVDGSGTKNAVGGDYGLLLTNTTAAGTVCRGLIFYQAGIVLLATGSWDSTTGFYGDLGTTYTVAQSLMSGTMDQNANAIRHRVQDLSFNNTTEINSTIYFCRVPASSFNYSANPTYVSGSKIVVKNTTTDTPVSYITTVGLYNNQNELLATAKLSEPLRKDPTNEIILRVRLDY